MRPTGRRALTSHLLAAAVVCWAGSIQIGCSEEKAKAPAKAPERPVAAAKAAPPPKAEPAPPPKAEPAPPPKAEPAPPPIPEIVEKKLAVESMVLDCAKMPAPKKVFEKICVFPRGLPQERTKAAAALAAMGNEALPHLRKVLGGNNDLAIRSWVVLALKDMDRLAAPAVPELVAVLDDPSPLTNTMKTSVMIALQHIGPGARDAIPALLRYYKADPTGNFLYVAETLGEIGTNSPAIEAMLIRGLGAPKAFYRATSAKALGRLEPPPTAALGDLKKVAADQDPKARAYASAALYRLGGYKDAALLGNVTKLFEDPNWQLRQAGVLALGEICPKAPGAAEPLLKLAAREQQPWLQGSLARALGLIGHADEGVVALLTGYAAEPDEMPSRAAVVALGRLGPAAKKALPALRKIVGREKGSPRGIEAQRAVAAIAGK